MTYSTSVSDGTATCFCLPLYRWEPIAGQCVSKASTTSAVAIAVGIAVPLGILAIIGLIALIWACMAGGSCCSSCSGPGGTLAIKYSTLSNTATVQHNIEFYFEDNPSIITNKTDSESKNWRSSDHKRFLRNYLYSCVFGYRVMDWLISQFILHCPKRQQSRN